MPYLWLFAIFGAATVTATTGNKRLTLIVSHGPVLKRIWSREDKEQKPQRNNRHSITHIRIYTTSYPKLPPSDTLRMACCCSRKRGKSLITVKVKADSHVETQTMNVIIKIQTSNLAQSNNYTTQGRTQPCAASLQQLNNIVHLFQSMGRMFTTSHKFGKTFPCNFYFYLYNFLHLR